MEKCSSNNSELQAQPLQTLLEQVRQESQKAAELTLVAEWNSVFLSILQQVHNVRLLPKDQQGHEAIKLHRVLKHNLKLIKNNCNER